MEEVFTHFFRPRGVVVVGASGDPAKLGYALTRNLINSGYEGGIHLVNPKGGTLLGLPLYRTIQEIPDPVDLAVILVPAPAVPESLTQCGKRGIPAAIIATGGFRETGAEGAALEKECLAVANQYHMRLIGPNCIGLIDTHLPLDTTFLQPPPPTPGEVAFVSHSGAVCAAIIDWIRGQGFGLSYLVSLGNQVDVNETDVLPAVAADKHTKVVTLYMESVSNGRRFVRTAAETSKNTPLVALKVGRFESGRKAAASHTGALAGAEVAFEAAFRRAGVLRATTTEEMFQWARALAWCPVPKGPKVAVLTNAGGPGVTAADAIESFGLQLAQLSAKTEAGLKTLLPPAASLHDPVDMLASATPEQYAGCLKILLEDDGVDNVLVILPPPPPSTAGAVVKAMLPQIQNSDKPVVFALMGERMIQEAMELLRAAKVPEYRFPEASASALAALYRRSEILKRLQEPEIVPVNLETKKFHEDFETIHSGEWLPADAAFDLLQAYGIPGLKLALAATDQEAGKLAGELGFPLVLKVASADISHKSDVGGVLLNIGSVTEAIDGFNIVVDNARKANPTARIDGVHLQRMLPNGQDVITGVIQDAQFGPLVMFGSGGVEVEGLKDVAFALAPLTASDGEYLLEGTWAGRKLRGFRNLPPADRHAVLDTLFRLAQLAAEFPELAEVEINPLRALADGKGVFAVDVRIRKG
ncbi:MAG TPA: acetate--CoA ligase family protein [Longilinea sp.]|nr:acetate--CoA ligase family protein [Longilinea sp.]